MNEIFTRETLMPGYLIFPRALLTLDLNAAELSIYMLLLDRARISARSEDWQDELGQVFLYFPIEKLAVAAGRSPSAVKHALRGLEEKDLIARKRQGLGKPNRIYVKLPEAGKGAVPAEGQGSLPPEGQGSHPPEGRRSGPAERRESTRPRGRFQPCNKNYRDKTREISSASVPAPGETERLLLLLKKMEAKADTTADPLIRQSPGPFPGRPPSYP